MTPAADAPSEADPKLRRNEEAKLTANYLNGAAVACVAIGAIAPLTGLALGAPAAMADSTPALAGELGLAIAFSVGIHWLARRCLGELRA